MSTVRFDIVDTLGRKMGPFRFRTSIELGKHFLGRLVLRQQSRCLLFPGAGGLVPHHWCLAAAG